MSKIVVNPRQAYTEAEFNEICQHDEVVDENDEVVLLVELIVEPTGGLFAFLGDDN